MKLLFLQCLMGFDGAHSNSLVGCSPSTFTVVVLLVAPKRLLTSHDVFAYTSCCTDLSLCCADREVNQGRLATLHWGRREFTVHPNSHKKEEKRCCCIACVKRQGFYVAQTCPLAFRLIKIDLWNYIDPTSFRTALFL